MALFWLLFCLLIILTIFWLFIFLLFDLLFFHFLIPSKKEHQRRNNYNINLPDSIATAITCGYRKTNASLHQKHNHYNQKFVSPDGHKEIVFDQNGQLVKDEDQGSYNFEPPRKTLTSNILHLLADIIPWLIYR